MDSPTLPQSDTRPTWRSRAIGIWRKHVRPLLVIFLIVFGVRSAVADWNDVPSGSMEPSILIGDRIFVNKLAYDLKLPFTDVRLARWDSPQRGDIVVFFSPRDGTRLVKRVVGLPGDTIELRSDRLLVNGQSAAYAPLSPSSLEDEDVDASVTSGRDLASETLDGRTHPVMISPGVRAMRWFGPVTVPPGQYFMMGDNRDNSADSRYFGVVPRDRIVGRATAVVGSLDTRNSYAPRWDRFFQALR